MKTYSDQKLTPSKVVQIVGVVSNPISITVSDLRQMETVKLGPVSLVCYSGRKAEKGNFFKGVLLRNLLERASILCTDKKKRSSLYLVASATDNHISVFSFNEVFNTNTGDTILVAYEKNGEIISDTEGQIVLISTGDIKTGCRYLKAVDQIDVREAYSNGNKN